MDRTHWRWFPHWMIAAMALVFAVNGLMIYDAISTFPGQAGQDGFDLSNQYQRVLAAAEQQAALGWHVETTATAVPELQLTARDGTPLAPTAIEARVERPVGPPETTTLTFHQVTGARFQADSALSPGQWDLMLVVRAEDRVYSATRRLIVRE
jgi:nitrogen fixation protein FixH